MKRHLITQSIPLTISGLLLLGFFSNLTNGQEAQDGTNTQATMSDGVIRIQATMPPEVRMGEQFTYRVIVSNASDSVTAHDVTLKQSQAEGFSIESTSIEGQQNSDQSQSQSHGENANQDDRQGQQYTQSTGDDGSISMGTLMPGESKTLAIQAAADKEGQLKSCLELASYRPSVCLTTQVVKPELEITKTAPESAGLCEIVVVKYSVTNSGSGNIEQFSVVDELPEGLMTIDGDNSLAFTVDGLDAGQTRAFEARLMAQRAGEFQSRAVAKAENVDLTARSANTMTRVQAAELNTHLDGPSTLYSDQPATFTGKVTNTGNITARNVLVTMKWPAQSRLARLDEPTMSMNDQSAGQNQSVNQQQESPTLAESTADAVDGQNQSTAPDVLDNRDDENTNNVATASQQKETPSMNMEEETFTLDTLEPNQTATFRYVIQPNNAERVPTELIAQYVCEVDSNVAIDRDQSTVTSRSTASADVIRLAALRLLTVDNTDPVTTGQEVIYTIVVTNQGDAPDSQVEIVAELPEGLEFADAAGPSNHRHEGSTIAFDPIETLEPGADARYTVTAKVVGEGDVTFKANLKSESLRNETTSEEPTRLFSGQAAN